MTRAVTASQRDAIHADLRALMLRYGLSAHSLYRIGQVAEREARDAIGKAAR